MLCLYSRFFFNDTAPTEIYTLSLHDALPIFGTSNRGLFKTTNGGSLWTQINTGALANTNPNITALVINPTSPATLDRKSTRLNSSHMSISYAVFCLKKKKTNTIQYLQFTVYQ